MNKLVSSAVVLSTLFLGAQAMAEITCSAEYANTIDSVNHVAKVEKVDLVKGQDDRGTTFETTTSDNKFILIAFPVDDEMNVIIQENLGGKNNGSASGLYAFDDRNKVEITYIRIQERKDSTQSDQVSVVLTCKK